MAVFTGSGSASAPSFTFSADTNTGIFRPTTDAFAVTTNGGERMRINSNGQLLINSSTSADNLRDSQTTVDRSALVQIQGINGPRASQAQISWHSSTGGYYAPQFWLAKSNASDDTIGTNTIVTDATQLGAINFAGNDGSTFLNAANITAAVDGTPGANDMPGRLVFSTTPDGSALPSERMRIDSSGRLLVGTSTAVPVNNLTAGLELHSISTTSGASASLVRFGNDAAAGPQINLGKSRNSTLSAGTVVQANDSLGTITFCGDDGTDLNSRAAMIVCEVDDTPGANDMPGRLRFFTTSPGFDTPGERMRITSGGDVLIGNSTGVDIASGSSTGHQFFREGSVYHVRAGDTPLSIGRNTNDGNLVAFYQAGTAEGSISIAGSTVSYNPFLGSHWGRLADGSKPDILPGTILDTIDQLIEWKQAKFTVDGEEKTAAYNGPAEVGDTVEIDYEGISYSAIVQNEEEEPEELNKHVCVKVNDTASSKAVFGVFLGWDNDIPENMVSTWNDLYCAAVGNYFVRIADGETLEIGSLIEADGNGCGIVQDDDIIRSKTVAKITSTIPQKVYDDGSFLVTCVLCCG